MTHPQDDMTRLDVVQGEQDRWTDEHEGTS